MAQAVRTSSHAPSSLSDGGNGLFVLENFALYFFGAVGERDIYQPTAAEIGSVHAHNYGVGLRFNLPSWTDNARDTCAFVEASRGCEDRVRPTSSNSSRIFAGIFVQY